MNATLPSQSDRWRSVPAPLRSRIVIGDWGPGVRDAIDVLRLTCLIGFLVYVAQGDVAVAARLGVTAVLVYAARWLDLPRLFDLTFVVAMALQGWGTAFDLFETIDWYDVVVHLLLSAAVAPLLYIALARLGVVPDLAQERTPRRHLLGIFVMTFSFGIAIGSLFELYEYAVNAIFGPTLETGYADTIGDLAVDAVGAAVGGALLVVWAAYGWATMRRTAPVRAR